MDQHLQDEVQQTENVLAISGNEEFQQTIQSGILVSNGVKLEIEGLDLSGQLDPNTHVILQHADLNNENFGTYL